MSGIMFIISLICAFIIGTVVGVLITCLMVGCKEDE